MLEWPFPPVREVSGTVSTIALAASALVLVAALLGRLQPRWVFLATSLVELGQLGAVVATVKYVALVGGSLRELGQSLGLHLFIATSYFGLLVLTVVGLVVYYRSTEPLATSGRAILARMCALSPLLAVVGWYIATTVASTLPQHVLPLLLTFVPSVPITTVCVSGAVLSAVSLAAAADKRQRQQSLAGVMLNALVLLVVALASALIRT